MAKLIGGMAIALAGVLLWRLVRRRDALPAITDQLSAAIERSNLPAMAKDQMHALIAEHRMRPSQFDGVSV